MDVYVIFDILQKVTGFKQNDAFVSEYYHNLNSLWREFDILTKFPNSTYEARTKLKNHNQV